MRALFIFLALFFTSTPAVGWEQACLPGQSSLALAMDVDAMGVIHWARVGRLDGALYYGTWAPGGVMSEAIIAENISRSSNFEVRHLGIITHSQGVDVCFPNALASRVEVASLRSGSWARVVVESGIVSKGCDLAFDGATLNIAYAADGVLRLAYRDGGWHAQTIDATEEPVGEMPDLAVTPLGLAVAHRAGGDALRLTWWDGASWLSETPPHSLSNTGHEPALILDGDQVSVYHAVAASTLNVTSDVFVLETRGPLGGPYVTDQILANNLGGALDAARAGDRLDLITRQLSRSALFGSSDGLLIYTNDLMTPEYFFSNGSGDQRILVRAARVAHGPFDLPVFASIEDRSAYLGQPSQSVTCLWRPEDGDQDGLPDEAEASLGTDPDDQDTDGDGRTDGEEVLIDGTDPLNPPACIPVAEVCNNLDDDCDGRIDDDLTRPCYNGPAGTRGVGRCEDGAQSCVAGAWWACAGAVLPTAEICNGVDDDCDGQTDEGIAEVGGDCVGVGVGRCGLGALVCTADGAGLECLLFSPRAEICDGIDDDCDGQTDEGEQSCGVGACARTAPRCLDGADAPCVPGAPAANDATCDGIDDDCDGFTDENAVPRPISCGVGACRATGQRACSHGAWVDTCTPAAPLAANDVTCDGVDDDCDGQIDEDAAPQATACGVGACAATGQRRCLGGAWVDDCLPGAPLAARDLTCDGIDDDCDGQADEETTPQPLSCGVGACAAVGERRCWQGGWVELCEPGLPALEDRSCDGIDDNCDGQVDEGFLPRATACGVGACAALGQLRCVAGVAVDDCAPGAPTGLDEDCDGVDDDCDGATDEGFIGAPISCGEGECFLATTTRCVGGILDARCTPLPPPSAIDERCDGLDEDCDGQIDEEVVASPISCGVGACRALGARRCEAGAWVEACQPGVPAADDATCDGVDDDCDGLIDEDTAITATACGVGACAATGLRRCVGGAWQDSCRPGPAAADDRACDGVDDDCDGLSDEDFQSTITRCGVGACEAEGLARCVAGQLIDSCQPTAPAPDDVTCDGVDDDCDGEIDEGFEAAPVSCGVGACLSVGGRRCDGGEIVDDCTPGVPARRDPTCDGIDDDCDGRVDENAAPRAVSCGLGACAASGQERCVAGAYVSDCQPGQPAPSDAICDGIDEDCDGQIDEDYASEALTCGVGACLTQGQRRCVAGALVDDCDPGAPAARDATCDGIDNDCDGQIDEDAADIPMTCGLGLCLRDGARVCQGGRWVEVCTPGPAAVNDRICDGLDEDCDGQIDENVAPEAIDCGLGACQAEGWRRCVAGGWIDDCTPAAQISPTDANCDGIDEDCDGETDEEVRPEPTTCGVGACQAEGERRCRQGRWDDSCAPGVGEAVDLRCDGIDEDCDGQIDEDYPVAGTTCGVGACQTTGARRCVDAREVDDCAPRAPAAAQDQVCDGIDEDCDGQIDEDTAPRPLICGVGACQAEGQSRCEGGRWRDHCTPGPPAPADEVCDGLDEDCDGLIDEEFEPSAVQCGLGICRAEGQLLCQGGVETMNCTPGQPLPTDEVCDGRDEDCDGRVDEDAASTPLRCGVGACEAEGLRRCVNGRWLDQCAPLQPAPSDATCDGIDDDCDGQADEDFQSRLIRCGIGACEAEGQLRCLWGVEEARCEPAQPAADDAICDGVDADCDGEVDEDALSTPSACGVGACAASGTRACVLGGWRDDCVPGPASPVERCNNVDDDCDGQADEGLPARPLRCGEGVCAAEGAQRCLEGAWISECTPQPPQAASDEDCDGEDDDCDGESDEEAPRFPLLCGMGACAAEGERFCDHAAGAWVDACFEALPAEDDATCDGIDDDCDGEIDEDAPREPILCGVGACAAEGVFGCVEGALGAHCQPGAPLSVADLLCDGIDEDCDGEIDEEVAPLPISCGAGVCRREGAHVCDRGAWVRSCTPGAPTGPDEDCDGLDNDCDGLVDEGCFEVDGGGDAQLDDGGQLDASPDGGQLDASPDGGQLDASPDAISAPDASPDGADATAEPREAEVGDAEAPAWDGGLLPSDGGWASRDGPPRRIYEDSGDEHTVSGRGGCGCHFGAGPGSTPLTLLLLGVPYAALRRRRRR